MGAALSRGTHGLFDYCRSVAAAGDEKDGDDDEPDPVVIEQIAEAVIHMGISLSRFARWLRVFVPPAPLLS